jgi:hypothetical protein
MSYLFQWNTQFLANPLELLQVFLVLPLVLDLKFYSYLVLIKGNDLYSCVKLTFKYAYGTRKVIYAPGSTESGGDDRRRGDKIVSKAVIEVPLSTG